MVHKNPVSLKELAQKKTPEELAAENEQLKKQITDLQLAVCEIFESVTEV